MKQYAHNGEDDETKTDYYSYDVLGNLTEHTTRNGDTIEYEYDVFNRLVKTTSDDGVVTYTYDNNGNILTMEDPTGTTTYTYDSMGRVLTKNHTATKTETETEPKKVSYTYDIFENVPYGYVAEITMEPDGDTVEKWYDSDDRIVKVIDGTFVTEYNYYADGRLKSTTQPNGSISTYTYDGEGNLLTLVTLNAAEDLLDSFTYVYDDNSIGHKNQISKTEIIQAENIGTTLYEYDIQGRLTKVTNPNEIINVYTYDDAGNRLSKTSTNDDVSVVTNYTYDEQNRLIKTVTGDTTTYYGYDNNGNQISEWARISNKHIGNNRVELSKPSHSTDGLMTLYEYDAFDRLIKIEQGSDVIENAYTADGKKLSRTTNGEVTYYVYDGNVVIEEQNASNYETARNVYGRNLITRETNANKVVMGYNGHGDVIYQASKTSGRYIIGYSYHEFGDINDGSALVNARLPYPAGPGVSDFEMNIDNPYLYAGYEYIERVNLYDLNARYYNPEIARFLSPDPYYNLGNRVIGLYEINVPNAWSIIQTNVLYAYCGNNPIFFQDENGLSPVAYLRSVSESYNANAIDASNVTSMLLLGNGLNVWTAFHEIAQVNIARRLSDLGKGEATLEYSISYVDSLMFVTKNKNIEADVVLDGSVWEVKPIGKSGEKQLNKYIEKGNLTKGEILDPIRDIPVFDNIKMQIIFPSKGNAQYSFYTVDPITEEVKEVSSSSVKKQYLANALFAKYTMYIAEQQMSRDELKKNASQFADALGESFADAFDNIFSYGFLPIIFPIPA